MMEHPHNRLLHKNTCNDILDEKNITNIYYRRESTFFSAYLHDKANDNDADYKATDVCMPDHRTKLYQNSV